MDVIDGLPNIAGDDAELHRALHERPARSEPAGQGRPDWSRVRSAFALALHMHQPLVPAGGETLRTARLIGNLQYMLEHPEQPDAHNAPVFLRCYQRMAEIIPRLLAEGAEPRIMLDYSGTLLFGLRQMGADAVLEDLRRLTVHPETRHAVEWLGAPWGHPVAPSTPYEDYRLHVRAWQHHFAGLFGRDALARVRGFSPAEMALPNHPDVAFAFVRTLQSCGYEWLLVQEDTVEQPEDGRPPARPHLPHRLVCRSATGEEASLLAVIKTQGADNKLIGQMQPYYEAAGLDRVILGGRSVPPLVTQIGDGENGGVMMNEFPPKFVEVMRLASGSETPPMNVSEYLDHLFASGVTLADLPTLQPVHQRAIWERFTPGQGPRVLHAVLEALHREVPGFHLEGGSWTSDLSWVRGYEGVLDAMAEASARFHERVTHSGLSRDEPRYRNALFHLLVSQTSCFRYWGEGRFTDYGRELSRRTLEILERDF